MRRFFFPTIILTFLAVTPLTSCSNDDKGIQAPGITAAQVNTIITKDTWRVSLYDEAGSIQTSDFSDYVFTFNADGSLAAVAGSATKNGTWNAAAESGKVKIPIAFPEETDGAFESITEDWIVLTITSTKIELQHTSGGDGGTDLLTFEKS